MCNTLPIDACKEKKGYSKGWLHHKGRNPHHYEYWIDNLDQGGEALIMPREYAFEMICDYIGAGKAYMGKNFTYEKEYQWWLDKQRKPLLMHPVIIYFIDDVLLALKKHSEEEILQRKGLEAYYNKALYEWKRGVS